MKKLIVLAVLLALFVVLPSARAYTIQIINVNRDAYEGESLNYTLNITNDLNETDKITYFDLIVISSFRVHYVPSSRVTLEPNKSATVNITIHSTDNTPLAIEIPFKIYFSSTKGEKDEAILRGRFDKKPQEEKLPVKPVIKDLIMADYVDPRYGHVLLATVYNPDEKLVEATINYSVKKGDAIIISDMYNTTLEPLTDNTIIIPIDLSYYQEPGNYTFTLRAYNEEYAYAANETLFEVGGFAEYDIKPLTETNLFGKKMRVNITNTGTAIGTTSISLRIVPVERWFRYAHEGNITYANGTLIFTATLLPGQTRHLSYTITYAPLIISPFLVLMVGYIIWYLMRKVEIKRSVVDTKVSDEEFSFKLMIRVKNISSDKIKNIRVKEKLLPFVKKVGSYGTLHPKIIKDATGKKLLWEIDELQPGDEAVITYRVNTSIGILGKILMPPTQLSFKYRGKTKSAKSLVLIISPDTEK